MRALPPETRSAIVAAVKAQRPYADICAEFGVSKNCVSKIAIKAGLRRAERERMLNEEQETDISARYEAGEGSESLAASFGISRASVLATLERTGAQARSCGRVQQPLRHDAFDVLTPDAAYWCGFLFTDGTIVENQTGQPDVALVLQKRDYGHLVKFRDFLGSAHAITPIAPHIVPAGVYNSYGCKGTGAFRFSVRSRQIADRLYTLGRYGPAVDPELAASRDFWRGCIDGDGTINISCGVPCIKLCGSQWLLQAFVDFLGPISSRRPIHVRPARTIFVVGTGYATAVKVAERLYAGAATVLDRKAESAAAVIRNGPGKTPPRKAA